MSYRSCVLPGLYVCRLGKVPEVQDVPLYASEIAAARESQGRQLVALFIMPQDSTAPGEAFRRAQAAKLPEIMANLHYAVAVFEGDGFFSSLKRSALVAILLMAPRRYAIHVRSSVEEALLTRPAGQISFDARHALHEIKQWELC